MRNTKRPHLFFLKLQAKERYCDVYVRVKTYVSRFVGNVR